jgi:hypothetical protein
MRWCGLQQHILTWIWMCGINWGIHGLSWGRCTTRLGGQQQIIRTKHAWIIPVGSVCAVEGTRQHRDLSNLTTMSDGKAPARIPQQGTMEMICALESSGPCRDALGWLAGTLPLLGCTPMSKWRPGNLSHKLSGGERRYLPATVACVPCITSW